MAPRGSCHLLAALVLALGRAVWGLRAAPGIAPSLDLVVAAETAKLGWIDKILELPGVRLRLYCRGAASTDHRCVVRESAGSSESLMLRHIVDHYTDLADVTVFTHDRLQDPATRASFMDTLQAVNTTAKRASFSGFHASQYFPIRWTYDRPRDLCRASASPFGIWYRWFVNMSDPQLNRVACTAASVDSIFAVSAARLRRVRKATYADLLTEVGRCTGSVSNMPGHFLSRSWPAMFSPECHVKEAQENVQRYYASLPPARQVPDRSLDIVVATYKAPLQWIDTVLQKLPTARLHLYCKGNTSRDPRCIRMENVGTEEYAYFHHILNNWDSLADITIFSSDNMENTAGYIPTTRECLDFVVNKLDRPDKRADFPGYEALDFMPVTKMFDIQYYHSSALRGDSLEKKELCRASFNPFGPWYLRFINSSDTNFEHLTCAASSMHGIFGVSRERIHRIPKSVFRDLITEVERCRGVNHFVAGHYMERSWAALFSERCHQGEAHLNLVRRNDVPRKMQALATSI